MKQPNKKQPQKRESWTDADLQQLLQGRKVPISPEAEAAVLGSMLLDRECIGDVIEHINGEAFSLTEHRIIFECIITLYERNSEIDLVLLRDELKKRKSLDAVGGVEYLVRIAESVPSSANAVYYSEIVKEKAMLRDLAHACGQIINEACEEGGEVADKLDTAEQRIFEITERKIQGNAEPIKDLITQAFESIESRKGLDITGKPTGFMELDQLMCGLHNGELIIVAGRPSMGKTSFALNIAEHIGADENLPVVIFSLEMSRQQLAERFLCSRSGVDSQLVRKGMLSTDEMSKLTQAGGILFEKPIYIDDTPGLTPLMMRAKCRRLKSRCDIQAVFVDYLQLMGMGGYVESRQQEISTISRYLKALARELNVPVIVLSQLNRAAEGREGHRPRMSDLRESGSIEQDADVVMLLHREDYYHRGEPDWEENNIAEIIIAKQRNGPTGSIDLIFDGRLTRFKPKFHQPSPF
ncbi:MAG: replicative DNA helicase [Planctomycetaceae bacterium]|nr:replicative DNA helicase [Planctomycetaceae bacterium]